MSKCKLRSDGFYEYDPAVRETTTFNNTLVFTDTPYTMADAVINASIKAMIDELDTVLEEE
jgi:hypothetical protein